MIKNNDQKVNELLKIAVAQISTEPGNISENTKKIIDNIKKAKKAGADIIIFPELAIPGYMSLDLMLYPKFIQENKKALGKIKKYTKDILVIVGFIDQEKNLLGSDGTLVRYNSAAVLYNQKILAIQDKTLLPNYDVFFEDRYFAQGRGRKIINFRGLKLGIQICEDLWDDNYPIKVSQDLIEKGADFLINISGSPFYIGKRSDREKIIKKVCTLFKAPFIYANCVGVQDGYDGELIFDGQSMIFNNFGQLISLGKEFSEDLFYTSNFELFQINDKQKKLSDFSPSRELLNALIFAIKEYFRKTGFSTAFIGLSGGIDSAVVASLAVQALGKNNVVGIAMPSQYSSIGSLVDAKKLAQNLGIKLEIIPIKNIFAVYQKSLSKYFKKMPFDTTEENIQARVRGMILMAHANKFKGLVISTANKTETALGYTTLYGDMCGAIAPLADVSKLKVYELAECINKFLDYKIPQTIIEKNPSAELKDNQTDESSLGAQYSLISPLVDELIENAKTWKELSANYPQKIIQNITNLINQNEYKRRQAPPAVKVTKKAFGLGRRIPISHSFINK